MTMMRSVLTFAGSPGNFSLRSTLQPMIKWNIPLNDEKMSFFIQAFGEQYSVVEKALFNKLENNAYVDFKLFNTYGLSNNYWIGEDSTLLDNVHISISFNMAVVDRAVFNQTADAVRMEIKSFVERLNSAEIHNIYISNMIKNIETNHPNVHHLRFLGINRYDANKQSIRLKYRNISELREDRLMIYVPEVIQIDMKDIIINEELT